jgi:hypothetical protein
MDKNGDMFEGKYARELLNLPDGYVYRQLFLRPDLVLC